MGPVGRRSHSPPDVLQLAAHPLRWRLLEELGRTDRRVGELTDLLGAEQSLVSYHLGRLRGRGLVRARRSSKDARDVYYGIDLARCGELFSSAGAALHPGLRLVPTAALPPIGAAPSVRTLFACTVIIGR